MGPVYSTRVLLIRVRRALTREREVGATGGRGHEPGNASTLLKAEKGRENEPPEGMYTDVTSPLDM